jgi:hypothetical protein
MPILTTVIVQCDKKNCTNKCKALIRETPAGDGGAFIVLPEDWRKNRKGFIFCDYEYCCPEH